MLGSMLHLCEPCISLRNVFLSASNIYPHHTFNFQDTLLHAWNIQQS